MDFLMENMRKSNSAEIAKKRSGKEVFAKIHSKNVALRIILLNVVLEYETLDTYKFQLYRETE